LTFVSGVAEDRTPTLAARSIRCIPEEPLQKILYGLLDKVVAVALALDARLAGWIQGFTGLRVDLSFFRITSKCH
jgi:hypothetical protein